MPEAVINKLLVPAPPSTTLSTAKDGMLVTNRKAKVNFLIFLLITSIKHQ